MAENKTIQKKLRTPTFKRTDFSKFSKLGVRRKKKQVYRRPKGIDNKINKKMKGHLRRVMIGFKNAVKTSGLVQGLEPITIIKLEDLKNITEGKIGMVGKVGMKRKIEIAEAALEKKKRLFNLNPKTFLAGLKDVKKSKEEKKAEREAKEKEKAKAMKEAEEKEAEAEKEESEKSESADSKKSETPSKEIVKEEVKKVESGKESIPQAEKEIATGIAEEEKKSEKRNKETRRKEN